MKLLFEQLFYGRGARGYGILGFSSGAEKYLPRVQALCGAVGTPIGDYGGDPFLLSVPEDDSVIMLCGRRGAPDSMGRATLFFHVLIAMKADLSFAKADAFSLFAQGAFSDKMPSGKVDAIGFDVVSPSAQRSCSCGFVNVSYPCLFRSDVPLSKLVGAAVGDRVLDLRWATYSFQVLPDFDVQVIPSRMPVPQMLNEYDASGRSLHVAIPQISGSDTRRRLQTAQTTRVVERVDNLSSTMLKLSIVVNVVLIALCVALFVMRSKPSVGNVNPGVQVLTNFVDRVVSIPPSVEQMAVLKREAEAEYRAKLANKISSIKRLNVGDEKVIPGIEDYVANDQCVKDYIAKVNEHIDFVNKLKLEVNKP